MDAFGGFLIGLMISGTILIGLILWILWRGSRSVRAARAPGRDNTRTYLAVSIVLFSIVGVTALGLSVISNAKDAEDASQRVMSAILPLLGTWVGTVMAFYFGRENYETASQNARSAFAAARTTEEVLSSTAVSERMIDFSDKDAFTKRLQDLPLDQARTQEKLLAMLTELEQKAGNVGATWHRIPIVTNNGRPLYVLHDSAIYEFITKQAMKPAAGAPGAGAAGGAGAVGAPGAAGGAGGAGGAGAGAAGGAGAAVVAPADLTLNDLYNDPEFRPMLNESVRLVPLTATMKDAKAEMSKSTYCQDIFVTRSGTRDEEALGWITNNIIEDAGRV